MPSAFLSAAEKERITSEILANCDLIADCWLYRGAINPDGYGIKKIDGRARTVSRFMLAYDTRESIDKPGYDACHDDIQCPYKACCNPRHLNWGTKSENCKAREKRAREDREVFTHSSTPDDVSWETHAWVKGEYYADRCDPSIDLCLAGLRRGKVVHATTVQWEDGFNSKFAKVLDFLRTLGQETYQGIINP